MSGVLEYDFPIDQMRRIVSFLHMRPAMVYWSAIYNVATFALYRARVGSRGHLHSSRRALTLFV